MNSKIVGIGAYYPKDIKKNSFFQSRLFLKKGGVQFDKPSAEIISRFEDITEIQERRYAKKEVNASEMAYEASKIAIEEAQIDRESLDCIIVAHNWGDVTQEDNYYDLLPNIAAKVKGRLGIRNQNCYAYDILFGCPGWIQGLVQANYYIKAGDARRVLVIGTDTVSRVIDSCDIDSLLFSDGAGAVVLEGNTGEEGILCHKTISHCQEELKYLKMDKAYDQQSRDKGLYLKMDGKKVFRYAYENVPKVILDCMRKGGVKIDDVKYFLIHQANGKMLKRIAKKIFELSGKSEFDNKVFPMNIQEMGNNSVATIPTLLYEISNNQLEGKSLESGDLLVMASVGAGMHANCLIYQW